MNFVEIIYHKVVDFSSLLVVFVSLGSQAMASPCVVVVGNFFVVKITIAIK